MYEPNAQRLLQLLAPADVVLDIGGWARPFNRANYVGDAEPYATRGYYADGPRKRAGGDGVNVEDRRGWLCSGWQ